MTIYLMQIVSFTVLVDKQKDVVRKSICKKYVFFFTQKNTFKNLSTYTYKILHQSQQYSYWKKSGIKKFSDIWKGNVDGYIVP